MSGAPDASVGGMVFGQTLATSPITADELDTVIQNRTTPLNEYWGAAFTSAAEHTVPGAYYQAMQVPQDDLGAAISPLQEPPAGSEVVTTGYTKFGPNRYLRSDVPVMTEEDWKASPDYRAAIPFDGRMTEARAKAKAEIYDADQYRAWLRQNRPWGVGTVAAATTATLAGGAIDPSNYIPIFGPAFRAANMTRAAVIMARVGIGALDAGVITAATEPFIASSRRQFGEDTSFADQILDIALGAATGGIAGGFHGSFERIRLDKIDDVHPAKVAARLQTLGEAADALANDRPVDVGSSFRRSLLAGTALGRGDIGAPQEFRFRDTAPIAAQTLDDLGARLVDTDQRITQMEGSGQQVVGQQRLSDLYRDRKEILSTVRASVPEETWADAVRGALYEPSKDPSIQKARLDLADVENKLQIMNTEHLQSKDGERLVDLKRHRLDILQKSEALLTPQRREQLGRDVLAQDLATNTPVVARRTLAEPPVKSALPDEITPESATPFDTAIADTAVSRRTVERASLDTVAQEKPGTPQPTLDTASAAVGKPQTMATDAGAREIAAEHGISPETGDFEEMGEINRLATAEQLTADERAALKESDATLKRADDYAKAYQAAAACMGRD